MGCGNKKVEETKHSPTDQSLQPTFEIPQFADITKASGITAQYENSESQGHRIIVESMGGGVGICDFDADGYDDIAFPGGGTIEEGKSLKGLPNFLWRNLDGKRFNSVSEASGFNSATYYSHGISIADFNADGFPDALITGYGGVQLFVNHGDGTFYETAAESEMLDDKWSTSAGWADFNGDGNTDVFVTNYVDWSWNNNPACFAPDKVQREVCTPQEFNAVLDVLYTSNGDGTFKTCQENVGISVAGKGLGIVAFDANEDLFPDIYVANDTTNNLLFLNDGNGNFQEQGVISGTAFDHRGIPNGSMGIATLDYDNDLMVDVWVTNYENETYALYKNEGQGNYRCVTESTGITAIGTLLVGFGTIAADFTRSGNEDIIVSNGHVMLHPVASSIAQNPVYLKNSGDGKLHQLSFPDESYFSQAHRGRGVAYTDFNNDGKLDLAFSHTNEPASLLQQTGDLNGQWFAVKLIGTKCNRDAIGSKLVFNVGNQKVMRTIVGGGSYLSQSSYTVWVGTPAKGIKSAMLDIDWGNGTTKQSLEIPANKLSVIVEGEKAVRF